MRILPNITNPHRNNVVFSVSFRVFPWPLQIYFFFTSYVSLLTFYFVISTYSVAIKHVQDLTGAHDFIHQQD